MHHAYWIESIDDANLDLAVNDWRRDGWPFHLLALLPEAEAAKIERLQDYCRRQGLAVAGALFPELIVDDRMGLPGAILIRVVDAPPPLLLPAVSSPEAVPRTAEALAAYVEAHLSDDDEQAALFTIFDALVPNIATHLDAWYLRLADRVRYFGVNAGNERFMPAPCLFDGERCLGDGLLVQLLPEHPGACLEHGYGVPETMITATSAEGNRIVQIDWRPALDVYRELMQRQYGVAIDRDNFYSHAVHFPFGVMRADGEILVRIPVALDADGGIVCVGEIPANAVLTLLDARSGSALAPAHLAEQLRAAGLGAAPAELLVFYCAGRRLHMGSAVAGELAEIMRQTGARRLLGALSLGEIGGARAGGYPLFHNATLVGMPCPAR